MTDDRPATLPSRVPRPAPDRDLDPAAGATTRAATETPVAPTSAPAKSTVATKAAKAPAAPAKPARRRERVVVLNTRVAEDIRDLIDEVSARDGKTIREVVEEAITAHWAS